MNWSHVNAWLSTLYGNKEIPSFERTNKNLEILNNLKKLNFNSTKLVEDVIINTVEIDTSSLTLQGNHALHSLAEIAQCLGIGQTELTNYYSAISQLSIDRMENHLQIDRFNNIETALNQYDEELVKMEALLAKLQDNRDVNKSEHMINQIGTDQSEYLFLEKKYNNLGIRTRLGHLNEIDSKSDSIERLLLEQSNLLMSYQALPSDLFLASIKIQETEDRLHELEAIREDLLMAKF